MIKNYVKSEFPYHVMGLYFLLKKNYIEAKKCFYKSIENNCKFGPSYLGLGISYSELKDYSNAIECFKLARNNMPKCYKPILSLAFEYHKMQDYPQAKFYYKQCLERNQCSAVVQKYSAFLILNEKYSEALKILKYRCSPDEQEYLRNESDLNLLKCMCYLFTGDIKSTACYLQKSEVTWKYYTVLGFVNHLGGKMQDAIENYHQALFLLGPSKPIENLLAHAIEIVTNELKNKASKYSNDLFLLLDLKSTDIDYI